MWYYCFIFVFEMYSKDNASQGHHHTIQLCVQISVQIYLGHFHYFSFFQIIEEVWIILLFWMSNTVVIKPACYVLLSVYLCILLSNMLELIFLLNRISISDISIGRTILLLPSSLDINSECFVLQPLFKNNNMFSDFQ